MSPDWSECVQVQETPLLSKKRGKCVPGRGRGMCKGPVAGAQGARRAGEAAAPGPLGTLWARNHALPSSL